MYIIAMHKNKGEYQIIQRVQLKHNIRYIVGSNPSFHGARDLRIIILHTDRVLILVPFQHGVFQLHVSLEQFYISRKFLKCSEHVFEHSVSVS